MVDFRTSTGIYAKLDGVELQYQYLDGYVSSPAKPITVSSLTNTLTAVSNISIWSQETKNLFTPAETVLLLFEYELKKQATQCVLSYEINGVKLTDATFLKSTGNITLAARPAFNLPWSDFTKWRLISEDFLQHCKNI